MTWTDARVAQLRTLWADGYSCSQIAAEFGITRNAVVGKAHRLKLPPRRDENGCIPGSTRAVMRAAKGRGDVGGRQIQSIRRTIKRQRLAKPAPELTPELTPEPVVADPPEPVVAPPIAPEIPLTFAELGWDNCRWPLGDLPDLRFCGAPRSEPGPYCAGHYRLGHQPLKPTRSVFVLPKVRP